VTENPGKLATVDFANLTDEAIAARATNAARAVKNQLIADELGDCSSGHLRLSIRETVGDVQGEWRELINQAFDGGERFAVNTVGKIETSMKYFMDSEKAVQAHGLKTVASGSPNDPRGWPGGVYQRLRLVIGGVERIIEVAAAYSGYQGDYDIPTARSAAEVFARTWKKRLEAQYGLAA